MEAPARMRELIEILNAAAKAYYQDAQEIMSNYEYDALYDELEALEIETGIVMSNSPTVNVGYELLSELPKEDHPSPMLSLSKTKSVEELKAFAGKREALLSWKMDGLTVVLTYENGALSKAVTRGNGVRGEVITPNARTFTNIPLKIRHSGRLVLRGEAVISYSAFEKINAEIADEMSRYKNPRNLCSGSVRQLDSRITASRSVSFYAFSLVEAEGVEFVTREEQLVWLKSQGFDTVFFRKVDESNMEDAVKQFAAEIEKMDIPSDGLVLLYNDIAYGRSLGTTAKAPRDSIAFKWADETQETHLLCVEWSASRTGLLNPVAVFEPVELEGTTVKRASVHNVSIVEDLKLGIGDLLTVYKANMIIPQIAENLTGSGTLEIPNTCPVCGGEAKILIQNDTKTLNCMNPDCMAKKIKALSLLVSRDALNIEGLSEATLEKFVDAGMIHEIRDIYHLDRYKDVIVEMEGMGTKSYEKLIAAVENSRNTTLSKVIYSLGIEGIGPATAKLICAYYDDDPEKIMQCNEEELVGIEGIGPVNASNVASYFKNEKQVLIYMHLLEEVHLQRVEKDTSSDIAGKVFVITGSLSHYKDRKALVAVIEQYGGKATGSVSKNTDYLINNNIASASSKNKKANELGIPIISEEMFMDMLPKLD